MEQAVIVLKYPFLLLSNLKKIFNSLKKINKKFHFLHSNDEECIY